MNIETLHFHSPEENQMSIAMVVKPDDDSEHPTMIVVQTISAEGIVVLSHKFIPKDRFATAAGEMAAVRMLNVPHWNYISADRFQSMLKNHFEKLDASLYGMAMKETIALRNRGN